MFHLSRYQSNFNLYLGMSKFVLVVINIKRPEEFLSSFPAVNELTIRDGCRIQNAISESQKHESLRIIFFKIGLLSTIIQYYIVSDLIK